MFEQFLVAVSQSRLVRHPVHARIVGQPEELTPELLAALLMRLEPPDGSQVEVTQL